MERLRVRLERQKKSNGQKTNVEQLKYVWKLKPGIEKIRILNNPYSEDLFSQMNFYYQFNGGETLISPTTFHENDPINKQMNEMLRNSGGSKEIFKKAMQLKYTTRYYLPVLIIDKKEIRW